MSWSKTRLWQLSFSQSQVYICEIVFIYIVSIIKNLYFDYHFTQVSLLSQMCLDSFMLLPEADPEPLHHLGWGLL